MFNAPESIYDELYKYIKKHFLCTTENPTYPLKRFERGIIFDVAMNVNATQFPQAYLEWGEVSEIELFQSPMGWTYDLLIPMCLLVYQKRGEADNAVFTGDIPNCGYGIGDLVTIIAKKFWADHRASRFIRAVRTYSEWVEGQAYSVGDKFWFGNRDYKVIVDIPAGENKDSPEEYFCDPVVPVEYYNEWWIQDWTFSVSNRIEPQFHETEFELSGHSHRINPLVRGVQINFKFSVFEKDAFC